jgi:type VI secretion system protein ImpF
MVLSSRPRAHAIEMNPDIHNTVVNYGLEEGFFYPKGNVSRQEILRQRIATALSRFEPRLNEVDVKLLPAEDANTRFIIQALCAAQPVLMTLIWDDAMSCFYLSE